jgi:hypothetical protein
MRYQLGDYVQFSQLLLHSLTSSQCSVSQYDCYGLGSLVLEALMRSLATDARSMNSGDPT